MSVLLKMLFMASYRSHRQKSLDSRKLLIYVNVIESVFEYFTKTSSCVQISKES